MLPNKFKIIGLLIAIISLIIMISRVTYLVNRPPIVVTTKGEPSKASRINDSLRADKYYKSIVQTVDSSGKIIKSVTQTKSTVTSFKDPVVYAFDLLLIIGLLICVLSREKIEDERIDKIRLIAFRLSFIIGIVIGMLFLVLNYYSTHLSVQTQIMGMLAAYFIVFFYLKQREASY